MMEPPFHTDLVVGQLSDAFFPVIDGVASVVDNYARMGYERQKGCFVVTNYHGGCSETDRPYPVLRIPAIGAGKTFDYRIGLPFGWQSVRRIAAMNPDLLHVHSPFALSVFARRVRGHLGVPIVMTYHTKYSIDIVKYLKFKWLCKIACRLILEQYEAADEVWTVSQGAALDLLTMGYQGKFLVMENGCDMPSGPVDSDKVAQAAATLGDGDAPVLLFVGRMMWYKNIGLILDALDILRKEEMRFRMVFVGDGFDAAHIQKRSADLGLSGHVQFIGRVSDRELLRAYYACADLFVFPSSFDTSGLVVQEAAACSCPSLLLRGSCAAEQVTDDVTGFLVEETALSVAQGIRRALSDRAHLKQVGAEARQKIYRSWDETAEKVWTRYHEICLQHARPTVQPWRGRKRRASNE